MSSDDRFSDVEPPRAIGLSAGPGFIIVGTFIKQGLPVGPSPLAYYLVDGDESVLIASCVGPERPVDDWLSVFQSFEFVPQEGTSAAP